MQGKMKCDPEKAKEMMEKMKAHQEKNTRNAEVFQVLCGIAFFTAIGVVIG